MLGPAMDGGGTIAAADDAADGDDHDIDQEMFAISHVPRVGERFEVRTDRLYIDQFGCHATHPGMRYTASPSDPRPHYRASTATTQDVPDCRQSALVFVFYLIYGGWPWRSG